MFYITGDIHGEPFPRLNTENFPEQKEMTKDDYVIICGDFGLVWNNDGESKHEKHQLDELESRPFTTLFCDGNHENFDRLNAYPVEMWHGGRVHKIRPSVIHLMRGEVYDIDGKKFFVFGGARSHDIRDGILEVDDPRIHEWRHDYSKLFRINHVSWWKEEMPNADEMAHGFESLAKVNYKVDYIITHDMPTSTLTLYYALYGEKPNIDALNEFLEEVRVKTDYKHWFCGHHHDNQNINIKDHVLYEQIIEIPVERQRMVNDFVEERAM